jgi:hypothetical protein
MSLPQSTSYVVTMPMYLSSDHVTEAGSALSPTVTISKNGAAFANPNAGASTATTVGNNVYKFTLATQDSDTLGDLWVRFTEATCDPGQRLLVVVKATNGGLTALPDTAVAANASLLTSGTGTDQLAVADGKVLLQATQTGVTIPTVTTVTDKAGYSLAVTPPTSAAIATAVWQSLTTTNWGADTFGNYVIISNSANRSIGVTGAGSGHVHSVVHAMQSDVLTASALATDAVSEISSAVATILLVDGATNKLKVNVDSTINATVSGTIVNYVTIPSAVAQASIIPLRITMIRGDTLSIQLPAMGTLTGRTKLIFTAKATTNTPDAAALFQITEAGGLVTLLGSGSVTGTGSLVVANATTGLVNLTLSATATALIPATTTPYVWDCQVIGPSGTRTPISGTLLELPDVTLQAT